MTIAWTAFGLGIQNALQGTAFGRKAMPLDLVCLGLVLWVNPAKSAAGRTRPKVFGDAPSLFVLLFSAYALIWQFRQNTTLPFLDMLGCVDVLFHNAIWFILLVTVFLRSATLDIIGGLVALGLGFCICSGLNLFCDKFFDLAQESWDQSRFFFLDNRWTPPLARSAALLAMPSSVMLAVCLALLIRSSEFRLTGLTKFLAVLALGAGVATVKCQFRAHGFTIFLAVALAIAPASWRPGALVGVLCAFFLFPLSFASEIGQDILDLIQPEKILTMLGSTSTGVETLSDRTFLYGYGWTHLLSGEVGLLGDGPVLRDSSPAILQNLLATTEMHIGFHAGLLDILIPWGWLLGPVILFFLVALASNLVRTAGFAACDGVVKANAYAGMIYLTLWLAMSTMDGGFPAAPELFFMAVIPVLPASVAGPRFSAAHAPAEDEADDLRGVQTAGAS